MSEFEEILRQTEARYAQRAGVREATLEKLEAGSLWAVNPVEAVEQRMDHLQLDQPAEEALRFDVLERMIGGTNELMSVNFLERGALAARTVGRIHVRNPLRQVIGFGTGFMVSPSLLMTNNHVLRSAKRAGYAQVEFNYQAGHDGRPAPSRRFGLAPDVFFVTDEALDYTLVAIQPGDAVDELTAFGWTRLLDDAGLILNCERVNIIQHPNGEPKQLSLRENQLVDIFDDFVHYQTDTAPGSSGSPVFNDQWEIVSLHHSGVPRRDEEGHILTRSGLIWAPGMGEHMVDWVANEGIYIPRILQHIAALTLSPKQRKLRAEMLEAEPPTLQLGAAPVIPPAIEGSDSGKPVAPVPQVAATQEGATWTIPLEITVKVGTPSSPVVTTVLTSVPAEVPQAPPMETPELQEALAELAASRQRVYYDEAADARARDAYYEGVLDHEFTPGNLYHKLSQLLRVTHTRPHSYKPSRHLYPWIDLHPDHQLHSIYSGEAFDPEVFIREDFRIEQEFAMRVRELMAQETLYTTEELEHEIDLLEAQYPYNCEHVVPQSWFGKSEPMRGDLHHLFACEMRCNSFRSNYAYFDFTDLEEKFRHDCGEARDAMFEPYAGKGAVARATLYFLIRYPGRITSYRQSFKPSHLSFLLAWHEGCPPDVYEQHRNMAIFHKQGNRNPLIDFPEWAAKIDFDASFE